MTNFIMKILFGKGLKTILTPRKACLSKNVKKLSSIHKKRVTKLTKKVIMKFGVSFAGETLADANTRKPQNLYAKHNSEFYSLCINILFYEIN